MKKKIFVVAAMITGSHLLTAFRGTAQVPDQKENDSSAKLLDEVVFTANKYPNKTSLTGKVVTIITRSQLERSGGRNLSQVLSEQAGIYIAGANSNPGKEKSVFLRGAVTEHTLITIDGIPVYDPSGIGSHFDLRNFSIDNIERIEILRGSQSTLYGSDALAGVINIITRKPDKPSFSSSGILSYGSYQTFRGNIGIRGKSGIIDYHSSYNYFNSKGINEAVSPDNSPPADKDGFKQNSVHAGFGLQPSDAISIQPFFHFSKVDGSLDQGAFTDELDYTYTQKSYQAGIRNEINIGKTRLNILYSYNDINRLYIDDSIKSRNGFDIYSRGSYKGGEHFTEVYLVLPIHNNSKLTAGADFRSSHSDQEYFSTGFFGSYSTKYSADSLHQKQVGIYTALAINAKSGFTMELGSRINFHSEYGSIHVFNINPSYLLSKKVKFFFNFSNAYRTPSLYQLFSEYGNKELHPESALTGEGGFQYFSPDNKITTRITLFKRNVKNVIFFYFNPVSFQSQYINQDRQKNHGGELEVSFSIIKNISFKLFYAYVDGKIMTKQNGKDTSYNNLLRRPKHSMGINMNSLLGGKFYISANLLAYGKRKDAYFDSQSFLVKNTVLDKYLLLDLYAEYGIKKSSVKFFADFRNVTDSKYTEVSGFNTTGCNVHGGFRFNF